MCIRVFLHHIQNVALGVYLYHAGDGVSAGVIIPDEGFKDYRDTRDADKLWKNKKKDKKQFDENITIAQGEERNLV